jgi:hypothetical protein
MEQICELSQVSMTPSAEVPTMATRISQILDLHEKMRNAYFWTPPGAANARRSYESRNSDSFNCEFELVTQLKTKQKVQKISLELECDTSCSCKNVYYHGRFYENGRKTTSKRVQTLLEIMQSTPDRIRV